MIVVAHRRNSVEALAATPGHLGVELDVRTHGDRLVVAHDPFEDGPDLDRWLDAYDHALMVVNIKGEGCERLVRPKLVARGIEAWFFLDLSMAALMKQVRAGEHRVAARASELERVPTALALQGLARWVWIDGFHGFPLSADDWEALVQAGYRTCLCSPELHGRPPAEIAEFQDRLEAFGATPDAVCTREIAAWETWAARG